MPAVPKPRARSRGFVISATMNRRSRQRRRSVGVRRRATASPRMRGAGCRGAPGTRRSACRRRPTRARASPSAHRTRCPLSRQPDDCATRTGSRRSTARTARRHALRATCARPPATAESSPAARRHSSRRRACGRGGRNIRAHSGAPHSTSPTTARRGPRRSCSRPPAGIASRWRPRPTLPPRCAARNPRRPGRAHAIR